MAKKAVSLDAKVVTPEPKKIKVAEIIRNSLKKLGYPKKPVTAKEAQAQALIDYPEEKARINVDNFPTYVSGQKKNIDPPAKPKTKAKQMSTSTPTSKPTGWY